MRDPIFAELDRLIAESPAAEEIRRKSRRNPPPGVVDWEVRRKARIEREAESMRKRYLRLQGRVEASRYRIASQNAATGLESGKESILGERGKRYL